MPAAGSPSATAARRRGMTSDRQGRRRGFTPCCRPIPGCRCERARRVNTGNPHLPTRARHRAALVSAGVRKIAQGKC